MGAAAGRRRVFIGPTEVAGIVHGLCEGFTRLGWEVQAGLAADHPFGYGAPAPLPGPLRLWTWSGTQARRARALPLKGLLALLHWAWAWPVLLWALWRCQAFVFTFGNSITNTRLELWLLRRLRRSAVVVFVGSDARPPYLNGAWADARPAALAREAARVKRRVRRFERAGLPCINAPATAHFHERPVVNWFAIGFPRHAAAPGAVPAAPPSSAGPVRLVHSPSKAAVKGTAEIQAIVARLQQQGLPLALRTLSGLGNAEVLAALADCDLVLDQLYSDTPMAGLATEAAQLGKPALVGGYWAAQLPAELHGQPQPPSRFVVPEAFEAALRELVQDGAARAALGARAADFVRTQWDCAQVAERVAQVLDGRAPPSWCFDPAGTRYLAGCGLAAPAARERVRALVHAQGASALQLDDKPALRAALQAWAEGGA